jgi:hypothetical protein
MAREVQLDPDGRVAFHRLDADTTYTLTVMGWDTEYYVLETGLRPGEGEITVEARRGVKITGRAVLPAGAKAVRISVEVDVHGMSFGAEVSQQDGSFTLRGVPPGTWPVSARAFVGGRTYVGKTTATAPGSVTIHLEPEGR